MSEKNLLEKINELCPNNQKQRHSFFQLMHFVVGREPTHQGKIRSCKIELLARKKEIESVILAVADLHDRIRILELEVQRLNQSDEMGEIQARQRKRNIMSLQQQATDLKSTLESKEDEANFLIGLCEKLIEREPEKDWDSMEVQSEYWNAKLTREIETRLMLGEIPNIEDFKTVLALPNDIPIKSQTLKMIQERQRIAVAMAQKEKPNESK